VKSRLCATHAVERPRPPRPPASVSLQRSATSRPCSTAVGARSREPSHLSLRDLKSRKDGRELAEVFLKSFLMHRYKAQLVTRLLHIRDVSGPQEGWRLIVLDGYLIADRSDRLRQLLRVKCGYPFPVFSSNWSRRASAFQPSSVDGKLTFIWNETRLAPLRERSVSYILAAVLSVALARLAIGYAHRNQSLHRVPRRWPNLPHK
jgi:hypothetical protein